MLKPLYLLFLFITIISCRGSHKQNQEGSANNQVETADTNGNDGLYDETINIIGNPSKADKDQKDNYLIQRNEYNLSYNSTKKIPNWVCWHLESSDLGPVKRQNVFFNDASLPNDFEQAYPGMYSGSGFDKGHNCPSGDRTDTEERNHKTFLLTNVMPQSPDNNQGPWNKLENYCRSVTRHGKECYILCGNYGLGGENKMSETLEYTKKGKIAVPKYLYKIVLILKKGDNDLERIQKNAVVLAVIMPNVQGIKTENFRQYITSVDDIEQKTGLDFFKTLNPKIEESIEKYVADPKTLKEETLDE